MSTETTYLAIYIETTGDSYDDHVVSIGAVVGDTKGNVIEKKRWCLPVPKPEEFDKKCWTDYWSKPENFEKLEKIKIKSDPDGLFKFCEWLNDLEKQYEGTKLEILSNNPEYDIGRLNHLLYTKFKRLPLRYTTTGVYRWIHNPLENLNVLGIYTEVKTHIVCKNGILNDHNPSNYARFVYLSMIVCEKIIALSRIGTKEAALQALLKL